MRTKKKRPAVDWLRWARKPFLYTFYSLGALIFLGLERLEAVLGGKAPAAARPSPLSKKLMVTFSSDVAHSDLLLPFVPLFGGESKWIKLKPEYIFKDLQRDGHSLVLTGNLYGRTTPEGPYHVGALVFLASQKEVGLFIKGCGASCAARVTSVLSTRRTGGIPHAKGLLLKLAVGSKRIELAPPRGSEALIGAGAAELEQYLQKGAEYQHLFLAATVPDLGDCLKCIQAQGGSEMRSSVYACLNMSLEVLVPVFVLEPPAEKVRMEDAALLFIEAPQEEEEEGGGEGEEGKS